MIIALIITLTVVGTAAAVSENQEDKKPIKRVDIHFTRQMDVTIVR